MRVAFSIPALLAVGSPRSGVLVQAKQQALALRRLGVDVVEIDSWDPPRLDGLDVLHFFQGGFSLRGIERIKQRFPRLRLVFAPMIDSNRSNTAYRLAAELGRVWTGLQVPAILRAQALGSDAVVCRSTWERQRVIRGLGIPDEKAYVVLNGARSLPRSLDPEAELARLDVREPFALHVSIFSDPRKNVLRLLEAIRGTPVRLVLAGAGATDQDGQRVRAEATRNPNVRVLSELTEAELGALYARCRAFFLPSIHEGTGLAALEAASWGSPVVVTENGGPRDYFGEAAIYVKPESIASLRRAVVEAWSAERSSRLAERVTGLTWDASARGLLEVYEKMGGAVGGGSAPGV